MKKTICILMTVICLVLTCSAYAETDFTLRGGIHFGDDSKTVSKKEQWTAIEGEHIFKYEGSLAGIPSMVTYSYEDDQLKKVLYCLNTKYDQNGKTVYSRNDTPAGDLLDALTIKYGLPYFNEKASNIYSDITLNEYVQLLSGLCSEGCTDFESISGCTYRVAWVIPSPKYNVLIDLRMYDIIQNGQKCYLILLEYCRFTEEDARIQAEMLKGL